MSLPRKATAIFLLDMLPASDQSLRPWHILIETVVASVFGIACGYLLFPGEASLVGVFLIALGLTRTVESLLDRTYDDLRKKSARGAELRLAKVLMLIFLGVLGTYVVALLIVPLDRVPEVFGRQVGNFAGGSLSDVDFGGAGRILSHNLVVGAIGFMFSLVYRHAGMLLMLAWNASVWGVVFPYTARTAPESGGATLLYLLKTVAAITPHLVLEAVAYVFLAMAGVYLSKALRSFESDARAFRDLLKWTARTAGAGLAVLVIACGIESTLAPALVDLLFR